MGTCKPSIICLDNGLQLCAGILDGTEDEEIVSTTFPLEIRRIEVGPTTEAISLRPWLSFTVRNSFKLKQSKILAITPLHEQYHEDFYKMTTSYMEDRNVPLEFNQEDDTTDYYDLARQIMAEEPPDEWLEQHDNLTLEELMESLKNMGPKRNLH